MLYSHRFLGLSPCLQRLQLLDILRPGFWRQFCSFPVEYLSLSASTFRLWWLRLVSLFIWYRGSRLSDQHIQIRGRSYSLSLNLFCSLVHAPVYYDIWFVQWVFDGQNHSLGCQTKLWSLLYWLSACLTLGKSERGMCNSNPFSVYLICGETDSSLHFWIRLVGNELKVILGWLKTFSFVKVIFSWISDFVIGL